MTPPSPSSAAASAPEPGKPPRIVPREQHSLSRRDIDPDALKVLYRLHRNDFKGFLVGGGVRDLLLDRRPKDFDIATDATPSQIRRLFRNSRVIGRRFPLVHVFFRDGNIVEVSTFRQNATDGDAGPLSRDDTWGTPEDDAWRRDLTINGLFYDIDNFSIIDYVGGLEDLDAEVVRTIGDPVVRIREDPVRMIRAVRHAARISFRIEDATWNAICELRGLIHDCAPARVIEEFLRELRGGAASPSLQLLYDSDLLYELSPPLAEFIDGLEDGPAEPRDAFWDRLDLLDRLAREEGTPPDSVTLATVFGPVVSRDVAAEEARTGQAVDVGRVVRDTLIPILQDLSVPRRVLEKTYHVMLAGRRLKKAAQGGQVSPGLQRRGFFAESWAYLRILLLSEGWDEARIDGLLRGTVREDDRGTPGRKRRRRRRGGRRGDT
jgi:poly(A) polymerase